MADTPRSIEAHKHLMVHFSGDYVALTGGATSFVINQEEAERVTEIITRWLEKTKDD